MFPKRQPEIETSRLILRPFRISDAPATQRLAGERDIADTTLNIPHPYEDGMAESWIGGHESDYEAGKSVVFAVVQKQDAGLVGASGLRIDPEIRKGELGYWIGKPYWNLGYATEAALAILAFGFDELELHRVHAAHFGRNPASGRVVQKSGMLLEGTARQDIIKWGVYEDLVSYGILREDWLRRRGGS